MGKFFIIDQIIKTQLLLGFLLFFFNCVTPITQFSFDGETMGTTYNIKIVTDENFNTKEIKTMNINLNGAIIIFSQ